MVLDSKVERATTWAAAPGQRAGEGDAGFWPTAVLDAPLREGWSVADGVSHPGAMVAVGTAVASWGYDRPGVSRVEASVPTVREGVFAQVITGEDGSAPPAAGVEGASRTAVVSLVSPSGAIGFADDAVGSVCQGMRSGRGHAMCHLIDEGLIPNSGSLASRATTFQDLTSPILRNPSATFNWRLGDTATMAFAGQAGGRQVAVFVAKEGPYQGRVISAVVPDANQVAQWGL